MTDSVQTRYESIVQLYARLIHGVDQYALIAKLQIYRSFLEKRDERGVNLWKIEPLLLHLFASLEQDVHLTLAKFFDKNGAYDFSKFLNFCLSRRRQIMWATGNPPKAKLEQHKERLAAHEETIRAIKARRDKVFAHRDKLYLEEPSKVYKDYPLQEKDFISLANCLISIVQEHEMGLHPGRFSFHLADFFHISVDNMVRNLETGRRQNFPAQEWD